MITKVQITGKMWNDIVAMQDRLVLLHNGFEDKSLCLTWSLFPYIGLISAALYDVDEIGIPRGRLDGFTCYVDGLIKGETVEDALDKITEWEKKYGFEQD